MRPVDIALNSATFSRWIPIDYRESGFAIGLGFSLSSGGSATASVQHTFDDVVGNDHPVQISQATTVITVTDPGFTPLWAGTDSLGGHGLSVGDWVRITGSRVVYANSTTMDGEYSVTSVSSATVYILTSLVSGTFATDPGVQVQSGRVYNHAFMTGMTTRTDGNYAFPPMAVRLLLTAYASGVASLAIRQGSR